MHAGRDASEGGASFKPRPIYRLLAAGGGAVALLFTRDILNEFSLATLFFLLATLGFAFVYLRWALMRLEVTAGGVTVRGPFQKPRTVLFRQMITCVEAGRLPPGLSLVYWPVTAEGFVETEAPRTLFLPAVGQQECLLRALEEQAPALK